LGGHLLIFIGQASAQIPADVNPSELVVKEGDPVQFVCRVGQPIVYCFIKTPNGRSLNLSPLSQSSNLGIQYMGEGFQQGQCGVRIERSSANDNGVFECNMGISGAIEGAAGQIRLTIARKYLLILYYLFINNNCFIEYFKMKRKKLPRLKFHNLASLCLYLKFSNTVKRLTPC
jgi:hypothetical protein